MLHFETISLLDIALFIAFALGVFAAFRWFDRRSAAREARADAKRKQRVAALQRDWDEKIGTKPPTDPS